MLWVLISLALIAVGYWFLIRLNRFWVDRGVKQGDTLPFFGNNLKALLRQQSFAEMVMDVYNMCPNTRYSGMYQFMTPTLVLRDPDLIKQITVKDFDHFLDHRTFIPEDSDPLWGKNLFALKGRKWREMRSTLSPAFTSSKMKYMFGLIVQNAEQFVKHFLKEDKDVITIEMKDTLTRFTNDVIANTAFGVEVDSLGSRNNEFYLMGKDATDFTSIWRNIKIFGMFLSPELCAILKIRLFSSSVSNFFRNLVSQNIASRQKHGIVRPDMIHILMEARKNGLKHEEAEPSIDTGFASVQESEVGKNGKKLEITDEDITAQALVFFFAGFDSVSALMCFTSYELGVNPDVQKRLQQEVDDTFQACGGKVTYEALLNMKYLDMVVSETLRKWPNAVAVDRICTKPYTIQPKNPDEKPLHLELNSVLWLPIFGIHRDPQYYPDPMKFDPERFNDENKSKINPYTYLPFGAGPRNCIGSRFALLETKALFFHILTHFEIVPVEKTEIPLTINKKSFNLNAQNGFWLGLKRRVK